MSVDPYSTYWYGVGSAPHPYGMKIWSTCSVVFDGDLVLVVDNDIMKSGVDRNCPVVIDVDDKITALSEPYDKEHIAKLIFRTMNSLIGETSNCATAYWNKCPKSEETKQKYMGYIDLLSVINGKAIDKFCHFIQ